MSVKRHVNKCRARGGEDQTVKQKYTPQDEPEKPDQQKREENALIDGEVR